MPNRLARETSPYLRQHADNPVDWYPWGDEAFERARAEDKLVFLSIGYSACHWCHVMAHESFEDEATARVMNELYVNVKVDREERPDVDAVYMEATQAMTGGGGWPMSVFITPDGKPVFAGTYFPKQRHMQRPSFTDLLVAVDEAWRNRRDEILDQAEQLTQAVIARSTLPPDASGDFDQHVLEAAYRQLRENHDDIRGGFGGAPKFPQPSFAELLLRAYAHNRSIDTLAVVETTLDAMASGGIYDHLGGGFARYSVDAEWLVPHFEKMLYDQAQLVRLYTHGWQAAGHERWRQVVEETVEYVLRDLRQSEGGISSAEDADSEGEEGKFYVWTIDEIRNVLADDAGPAIQWWGVTEQGNFEGKNILFRPLGAELLRPPEIDDARRRLFDERTTRVRPGLDDKVLTEWNAMWVAALAEAGAAFGRQDWIDSAVGTAEFLLANLRRDDGRWLRSWQRDAEGGGRLLAYAVDHAWLVEAFTRLAEATGRSRWIAEARDSANSLIDLFWDADVGGFFTTGRDAERLLVRAKELTDGATPSANSVAAVAFTRLAALTGDDDLDDRAIETLRCVAEPMGRHPTAFTYGLAAVDLQLNTVTEIVIPGDTRDLVAAVQRRHLPSAVLAWGEPYDSPLWEAREAGLAYVCESFACKQPVSAVADLEAQLAG